MARDAARETPFPKEMGALTSVRFLLAAGVVVFHYHVMAGWNDAAYTGLIERARLGVDVFFILSGFVLTHVYLEQVREGRYDHMRFMRARFARIYPAHVAVLAFVAVMVLAASAIGAPLQAEYFTLEGFVRTLFLTHAWFPTDVTYEWNGPSWSLSAEWFAYLAFPAFALVAARLSRRPWVLLGVAGVLFLGVDAFHRAATGEVLTHAEFSMGILRIIPEFLYGMALYQFGLRLAPGRRAAWLGVIGAAGAYLLLAHLHADERLIVAAAGPLVLSLGLLAKAGAEGPLTRRWMLAAGESSYALYLLHFPMIYAWKGGLTAAGIDEPTIHGPASLAALFVVTVAGSFILHYAWERPVRTWLRGRRGPGAVPASAPA